MNQALGELEKFIQQRSKIPLMIRFALVRYQFETIHPWSLHVQNKK